MAEFESTYNRLFRTRGADTKHVNDCELIWLAAVTAEREACANLCDEIARQYGSDSGGHSAERAGNAIRRRSND